MKKKKEKEEILTQWEKESAVPEEETAPEQEKASQDKMEEDVALFRTLFPDVKAEKIPAEVWERVEEGESLSAAFALNFVKELREKEKVEKINEENEKKAPPRIRHDGGEYDYFSPQAVGEMTPAEIKKNYRAILSSMDSWN